MTNSSSEPRCYPSTQSEAELQRDYGPVCTANIPWARIATVGIVSPLYCQLPPDHFGRHRADKRWENAEGTIGGNYEVSW